MSGPTCGRVLHEGCIRGCVRKPFHPGRCRCVHQQPFTTEDED